MSNEYTLLFCPRCSNLLVFTKISQQVRLTCGSCPYILDLTEGCEIPLNRTCGKEKGIDALLEEEKAWKNVESTDEKCPKCGNDRAYFKQVQIRSADEPMTTFYKCCNHECGHNWRF